jgi:hypothetical protein
VGGTDSVGVVSIFTGNSDGTFNGPAGFVAGNGTVANQTSNNVTVLTNTGH